LIANAIPGARLELFEGVGHLLPWERPEELVALVEGFLE
jgi:pimeloyl-ACP methyl ester carboxylesterase